MGSVYVQNTNKQHLPRQIEVIWIIISVGWKDEASWMFEYQFFSWTEGKKSDMISEFSDSFAQIIKLFIYVYT